MGFLSNMRADFVHARDYYEQARLLFLKAGDEFTGAAAKGNLANITWALGDLESTEASFRQHVALMRHLPMRTPRVLGWALASLAGVLIERGALEDALAAAREGLPLLLEDGSAWIFVSHLALRAALAGRLSDAARLAGYSDSAWNRQGATPHPVDARTSDRLSSTLLQSSARDELERLRTEGAALSEAEACELALAG
jgi:tetratricopeptide (TPR) repeat protein